MMIKRNILFLTAILTLSGCQAALDVSHKINKTLTFKDFEVYRTGAYYCDLDIKDNKINSCGNILLRIQDDESFASLTIDLYEGVIYFADVSKSEIDGWIKYMDDFIAWQPKESSDFIIVESSKKQTHNMGFSFIPKGAYPVEYRVVGGKKQFIIANNNSYAFGINEDNIKTLKQEFISLKTMLK